MNFEEKLKSLVKTRPCIGIGISRADTDTLKFLSDAAVFSDLIVFGVSLPDFESVVADNIEEEMVRYMKEGRIGGIVRGQLDAVKLREAISAAYEYSLSDFSDVAFVEDIHGRSFILCPISNQQGWSLEHKIKLIEESIRFLRELDIPVKIGVLAGVRPGSLGKIAFLDETFDDAEKVVACFQDKYTIKNYNIEFEKAVDDGCSVILEANGMIGNQVLRSMVFSGGMKIYGAPVCGINEVVLDTFRNSNDFSAYVLFCAALINLKHKSHIL